MKNISYLDMVKELLPEAEFLQFEKCYNNPIQKSIKILRHRWYNDKTDLYDIVKSTISKEWNLSEPKFSYKWSTYNDVLYAVRKENLPAASLWSHYLHQAWLVYVQEMAASLSVQMLWVKPWDYVLDMCAAPWGKSIQISDILMWSSDNMWFLISNEVDSWRKKALESNLHRCWIYNVWVIQQDWCVIWDKLPEMFDKVLVDAPCSGEWMQYKSDKKIWQWDEKKSRKLSELQTQLLISWLKSLKVWGELVYSTCTTNVLENEYVISNVLREYWNSIKLIEVPLDEKSNWITSWRWEEILSKEDSKKVARLWPHIHNTWWFFIAKFKKVGHIWNRNNDYIYNKDNINKSINEKIGETHQITEEYIWELLSTWWIKKDTNIWFFNSNYTINIAPKILLQSNIKHIIPNINIWLPIFKIVNDSKNNAKKLVPLNWISQIFWWNLSDKQIFDKHSVDKNFMDKNILPINDEQLKILMNKWDLKDDRLNKLQDKYVLLTWNWVWVWSISVQNGIWKNKCF